MALRLMLKLQLPQHCYILVHFQPFKTAVKTALALTVSEIN